MRFEWDASKASANLAKHGVSFDEAMEIFYDPNVLERYDALNSIDESRFIAVGLSSRRLLNVAYAERANGTVRLISARKATGRSENSMSDGWCNRPFVFSVVEDDGENVTIEVSEEDYQKDLTAGVDEELILKPGRYKMKRGGFLARHPEFRIDQKKRA